MSHESNVCSWIRFFVFISTRLPTIAFCIGTKYQQKLVRVGLPEIIRPLPIKTKSQRRNNRIKTSTMVQELNYNVISLVIHSWEQVRRLKNYEEVAGAVLFQRYVAF
jgi:hypothetical protein